MSELTKIATILFKNLSDALLVTASEISKLDSENNAKLLSQAENKSASSPPEKPKLITNHQYSSKQQVLVVFEGSQIPLKCRVLKRLDLNTYLVYPQRASKLDAVRVTYAQILGLDPDR